jgi:hypothetical protein
MVAYPWYLLAIGLIIVVVGSLFAGLSSSSRSRQRGIDPRMRDDEIVRHLQSEQRISLPNLVVLVGLACIMVSIIWRLARLIW